MTAIAASTSSACHADPTACPPRAGQSIPAAAFERIRHSMMLHACKWDAQVEDVQTLAPFPLLMARSDWHQVAKLAEALAAETMQAEAELIGRAELHAPLSIPRPIRSVLREAARIGPSPCAVRVMRFDFHWTTNGWKISEVNSDVPGGFSESSEFPKLVATEFWGLRPAGNPGADWLAAMQKIVPVGEAVALLSAPGFMEDQQVVAYMAKLLEPAGIHAHLARLEQISWHQGRAFVRTASGRVAPAAIVRFHQAEWMARMKGEHWHPFFAGGGTPVSNPGTAVLTESKRFPLVWDALKTPMPNWRRLLPETRNPRKVRGRAGNDYLLKAAFCNTGDAVVAREWTTSSRWKKARLSAWLWPGDWVMQKRFDAVAITTPAGAMFPCVGVYVIDGKAAGAYARLSRGPVVNYLAVDAALLIEEDQG